MKGVKARFNKQTAGVKCETKSGKKFTLLNPDERARKFAVELRSGRNVYTGKSLTDTQKAHRSGYLKARKDSAGCYNSKRNKKK